MKHFFLDGLTEISQALHTENFYFSLLFFVSPASWSGAETTSRGDVKTLNNFYIVIYEFKSSQENAVLQKT